MITKDDIATYRANYNLDDWGVAGSLGFPTKNACSAVNALCDAYEEIERQRNRLLDACEIFMSHGVCEVSYYAIRDAISSVKGQQ